MAVPFSDEVYNKYYAGWGRTEAAADWANTQSQKMGGSSGGIPSLDEYINAIAATLPAPPKKYTEVNPFFFDEQNRSDDA